MPFFRVFVEGKNIAVDMDGATAIGFFATRSVRASCTDEAVAKVRSMVTNDWTHGPFAALNKGSVPLISVERVWRASFWRSLLFKNRGHVFYPDNEGEDEA
jgi:hypothetical protein